MKDSTNIKDYKIALHRIANLCRSCPELFLDGIGKEILGEIEEVAPNA